MADSTLPERLASLEAKMEILLDLLQEIKADLKEQPTREEFNKHLEDSVESEKRLESNQKSIIDDLNKVKEAQVSLALKVGIVSGIIGLGVGYIIKLFIK